MQLLDVYDDPLVSVVFLWQLLAERKPEQSISHGKMPTAEKHVWFFRSRPYLCWYLIEDEGELVGACYLTRKREVGIGILEQYKRRGYGRKAVSELMRMHPGEMLANINPANGPSLSLFEELGFRKLQVTYVHD
jgi:RimJ/RimL family protein N-acetyltransferase